MRILLFGKNGQLGWELQRTLAPLGTMVALDRNGQQGLCGDLANREGIAATLDAVKPDIIVNAAAYTAVDKAEQEHEQAARINAGAPAQMAEYARRTGARLVHYSTDYVFNGSGVTPWSETDPTGPVNHYGASKLAGEQAIQASGCEHLIFRTSWVYAARGNNFMKTMLNLARTRDTLSIVSDQIGAPTPARLIAEVSALAVHQRLTSGLYHLTTAGATSWHGFASDIFVQAGKLGETLQLDLAKVKAITSSEYPTPARRPLNSRLALDKLQAALGIQLPDWQEQLTLTLQDHLKG